MYKKLFLLNSIICSLVYAEEIKLEKSVITSATGFVTKIKDIASNPKVIDSKEIKEKQYNSVVEALENVPGIDIIQDGPTPIISLRGQGYDTSMNYRAQNNVKIMIDGIPCDNLGTQASAMQLNSIPMTTIERIEVIPGGGSVLYGSGTVGGVINIITKEQKGTRGNTDYKYGDTTGHLVNVNVGHTIDKFDFDLNFSKEKNTGWREETGSDVNSFLGKIRYDISDTQKLKFKYTNTSDKSHYADPLTKEELEKDREQNGKYYKSPNFYKTDSEELTLEYINKLTDNFEFNIVTFDNKTKTESHSASYNMGRDYFSDSYGTLEKQGVKAKGKIDYGKGNYLILGLDYIEDSYTSDGGMKSKKSISERDSLSAYLLNNYKIKENWDFITGIRYEKADYNLKTDDRTGKHDEYAYEVALNHSYSNTGSTYIKYEKAFLLPPTNSIINQEWKKGSDGEYYKDIYFNNIKPESTDNYEIGFKDYIGNTSINLALFYTLTEDEITKTSPFVFDDEGNMLGANKINYNIGKTRRKGIELAAEHHFNNLLIRGSYSYVDAEIKEGKFNKKVLDGTKMSNVAAHKINLGLDYRITNRITFMTDAIYSSGMYPGNTNYYRGYDLGKQNEYIVFNLKTKYDITDSLTLYAGINNIFNEKYYYFVGQDKESSDKLSYDPAPKRNYYAGFSYIF